MKYILLILYCLRYFSGYIIIYLTQNFWYKVLKAPSEYFVEHAFILSVLISIGLVIKLIIIWKFKIENTEDYKVLKKLGFIK